jgi:hypothetical protein
VRRWAIKALWKLLPMCMAENALPTTSTKWMSALNGAQGQVNQGEEAFLLTYFGRSAFRGRRCWAMRGLTTTVAAQARCCRRSPPTSKSRCGAS